MRVIIVPASNPPGKLADAELHFEDGDTFPGLPGLKLIGFSIWERRTGAGRNVTFPARQFSVNGERRSFALLRPTSPESLAASERVRALILDAFASYEQANAQEGTAKNGPTVEPDGFRWAADTTPPAR